MTACSRGPLEDKSSLDERDLIVRVSSVRVVVDLSAFKTKRIQDSVQSKHRLQAEDAQKRWEFIFYKVYLVCIKEITAEFFIAQDEETEDVVST